MIIYSALRMVSRDRIDEEACGGRFRPSDRQTIAAAESLDNPSLPA